MIKKYLILTFLALSNLSFGMEQAIEQTPEEQERVLEQLRKWPTSYVSTLPKEIVAELQNFTDDQIRQAIESSMTLEEAIEKLKRLADLKVHAHHFKDLRSLDPIINALALRFMYSPGDIARNLEKNGFEAAGLWFKDVLPKQVEFFNAIEQGNMNAIKQFIASHFNLNARRYAGMTPFILASAKGKLEIAQYLLKNGANINAQDNFGRTALMLASYNGYPEIVKLLLLKQANVNTQDRDGDTALMNAVHGNHPEIVKLLLKQGVDLGLKNKQGDTALVIAQRVSKQFPEHNEEVIKLLEEAMARQLKEDKN